MSPKGFAVAVPQFLLGDGAGNRAFEQSPENNVEGVIEPDDRLRFVPDQIADKAVISRCHPSLSLNRLLGSDEEIQRRGGCPVWFPVKGVQFNVVRVDLLREFLCQCGLTRRCRADHGNAAIGERFHRGGIIICKS